MERLHFAEQEMLNWKGKWRQSEEELRQERSRSETLAVENRRLQAVENQLEAIRRKNWIAKKVGDILIDFEIG